MATMLLPVLHEPPGVPQARVVVAPGHSVDAPVTVAGFGFTVTGNVV